MLECIWRWAVVGRQLLMAAVGGQLFVDGHLFVVNCCLTLDGWQLLAGGGWVVVGWWLVVVCL